MLTAKNTSMDIVQNVNHIFITTIVYVIKIVKDVQHKLELINVRNVMMGLDNKLENVYNLLRN